MRRDRARYSRAETFGEDTIGFSRMELQFFHYTSRA